MFTCQLSKLLSSEEYWIMVRGNTTVMIIWLKLLKQSKDMTIEKVFGFDKHFTERDIEVLNEHALR
jgi:hypothetical protein